MDALVEVGEFFHGKHILKTFQRNTVADLFKSGDRLSPHPLGGRIRCDILRVCLLQLL